MYSQNDEEKIILDYFNGDVGNYLDLGSFNGIELSNVRALAERGWSGIMVEPSHVIYQQLIRNYCGFNKIECYNIAVGTETKMVSFYDNHHAVATMYEQELKRWGDTQQFSLVTVPCYEINQFLKTIATLNHYDFISCDIEGGDLEILKRLDLFALKTRLICVEWNSKDFQDYDNVMKKFNFRLIHKNAENLIYSY